MRRSVFKMRVKPEAVDRYRREHEAVWPEVLHACKRAGISNYSIFMAGTELVAYFESDDPKGALEALAKDPVMHRWWAHMEDVMAQAPEDANDYDEVFHLD